ncbi:hypothetical protein JTB14_021573 [Gonioctena quinquepunctata]|nr:hypothetical protein JTB14_021573 [Gonioctena quinquepunctata]
MSSEESMSKVLRSGRKLMTGDVKKTDEKRISTSEVRAIVLQKRSLLYFCEECRVAFKSAPKLLSEIRDMRMEIDTLKQEMKTLKQKEKQEVKDVEQIVMELEREKIN